jgi:hypothetical protein
MNQEMEVTHTHVANLAAPPACHRRDAGSELDRRSVVELRLQLTLPSLIAGMIGGLAALPCWQLEKS